jgi:hypothetical protein
MLLDRWSNKRYGAVLFWVGSDMGLHEWGLPSLECIKFDRTGDGWHSTSGGGSSTATAPELLQERGPGLPFTKARPAAPVTRRSGHHQYFSLARIAP